MTGQSDTSIDFDDLCNLLTSGDCQQ